jgi:decaprenylphospho-beta-D-ribofuranose 2-oxidase
MGGAFAADIHGKNHHRDGTFSQHVTEIDLMLADGSQMVVNRDDPLFRATAGGMGLTGLITSLRLRMLPIETSRMMVETTRTKDFDTLLAAMVDADDHCTYSVAWVDTLAQGKDLGRAVLTTGEHAGVDDLPVKMRQQPLSYEPKQMLGTPPWMPNKALNRLTVAAFNEVWFRKAPKHRTAEIQSIPMFFHPLDGVRDWNRVYGSRGFLQYQFVVEDAEVVRGALKRFSSARCPVFLAVLKRFGPQNDSPLSFPTTGWTLALDIPTDVPGLSALLDELDEEVVAAGGRVYLAKDSRMNPGHLDAMYPRLGEFREIRERVDPQRRWRSDLSVRLGL